MKLVLFILSFLIVSETVTSGPFLTKAGILKANQGLGGYKAYRLLDICKKSEVEQCFDIADCLPDRCSIQQVMIDDPSRPQYAPKTVVTPCANRACFELIETLCKDEQDGSFAVVNANMTEVYCTRVIGYEQMPSDALLPDPALEQAKSDRLAAEQAAEVARQTRKARLEAVLNDANTPQETKDLIAELLRK